jgi:hypothetical protein
MSIFRKFTLLVAACAALFQLNGCATVTSGGECAAEMYNPTIGAALDSFESAAIAIKMSNRVLLRSPLSEQDTWPSSLFGAPSGSAMVKGAFSILGTVAGISGAVIEIDPETGFPRPQSALYIFLKDRSAMLDREVCKEDVVYFMKNTNDIFCPLGVRKKAETYDENVYRNVLMAYGVVTNNKEEMLKVESDIRQTELGFRQCDAWAHKSKEGEVKETYCKDPALKDEALKVSLVKGKIEDIQSKRKAYGPLANKVYNTSVAGADFSLAASTKIICAIGVAVRAIPNMNKEFKGWKGAVNIALLPSRIKNAVSAFGIYRDNLGLQITVYKTMYNQIKGLGYEIKEEEPKTKEALKRIEAAEPILQCLLPKFDDLIAGREVEFTEQDQRGLSLLANLYPSEGDSVEKVRFASLAP